MAKNQQNLRNVFKDILDHTYSLGIISEIKITATTQDVLVETIDDNNRVVIKGYLNEPIDGLEGEFGIGRLGVLKGIVDYPNLKSDNATSKIVTVKRNNNTIPEKIIFKDEQGTPWDHRFMSPELVRPQVDFVGVDWTVEFTPTQSEIQDFAYKTSVYSSDESLFTVKEENGELRFYVGENGGTYTVFNLDSDVKFKNSHKWPSNEVLKVLKLEIGKGTVHIHDSVRTAAMQILLETPFAKWLYIFPSASE